MNGLRSGCISADALERLARTSVLPPETESPCRHLEHCASCWNRYLAVVVPLAGVSLHDYVIVEEIGRGAASVVYAAWRRETKVCLVALKVLWLQGDEQRIRFEREAAIHQRLESPGIVKCNRLGRAASFSYYEMELVRGRPLDVYLAQESPPLRERLVVFERVCRALAAAHEQGIAHRDVKPSNILVDAEGRPHIVDFGIGASLCDDAGPLPPGRQTKLGDILGTIKYMSPEQAWGGLLGGPVDHRSDIWTLGVILYEIATGGGHPYSLGATPERSAEEALLHRIRTELPKTPNIDDPHLAPGLKRLISRCLAWDKRYRLQSAAELADEVERCRSHGRVRTRRLPLVHLAARILTDLAVRRRGVLWLSSVVATLFALSLFLFAGNVRWRETQPSMRLAETKEGGMRPLSPDDILVVGIADQTAAAVADAARRLGLAEVSPDIRTWRALHGVMMERLAGARPLAVVWDFFFKRPEPEDAVFVNAVHTLSQLDIPVVLAVEELDETGQPRLSPGIVGPLRGVAHFGGVLARDMTQRPGEFAIILRRGEVVLPSLPLTAVVALAHPRWELIPEWRDRDEAVTLLYQERGRNAVLPVRDRVALSRAFGSRTSAVGVQPADEVGCKTLDIRRPEVWERRVVYYERLLESTADELRDLASGKIVVFGDLRTGGLLRRADRHAVRYARGTVPDVPGCFLVADAVVGLSGASYLRSAFPLSGFGIGVAAAVSLAGCLLPAIPPVSGRWRRRTRLAFTASAAFGCMTAGYVLVQVQTARAVMAGLCAASFFLGLLFSTQIEATRQRFRVAPSRWRSSSSTRTSRLGHPAAARAPRTATPMTDSTDNRTAPTRATIPSLSEVG